MWGFWKIIFGPAPIEKVAKKVVENIANSSFRIFKDEDIRKMLDFSKIAQTEQDRIFNEFVVTGLSLAILIAETISELSEEKSNSFRKLRGGLIDYYPSWLKELGVEEQYCGIWRKLIQMRCDEYRKDFKECQDHLPDPKKANPWVSIVAIGGLHHLRRGKTSPEDFLFKHLLAWLKFLADDIEKVFLKI